MSEIEWLQKWYKLNCNGEWEHSYGVQIETIDNPGWYVKIDLKETPYEDLKMVEINRDKGDNNWIRCVIRNNVFEGFGDPSKFKEILQIFKNTVEA